MNSLNKLILKVGGLLALALLLAAGCAETPEDPDTNLKPDTFISSYSIDTAPDSATFYNVTVNWRWSDDDGEALAYRYWVDTGDSTETFDTNATIRLDFPNNTTTYTFYVQAKDNSNEWDETPASRVIDITETRDPSQHRPETAFIEGPADGSLTSTGIHVVFGGDDVDGVVLSYQYKLDTDADWSSIDNDLLTGSVALDITGMTLGSRSLAVRAVDNLGQVDASPAEVSFIVVDYLRPDLAMVSGIVQNAYFFLPAGGTTADITTAWDGDAAWYYSTLTFRYAVDDTSSWSPWQEETSTIVEGIAAGDHNFYVEAKDLGGNPTIDSAAFAVGPFMGDRDYILMNGIHFGSYEDEAWDFYNGMDFFTTYPAMDFWDAFSGQDYTNTPDLDPPLGTGAIPGDELGHYKSFIMIMNGFNGDQEIYDSMIPLLVSYLNAGGNIFLTGRQGSGFIKDDIADYCHISYGQVLVSISGLVAEVSGLVDQPGASLSRTDLPNIPTHEDLTVLFSTPDYPDNIGGFLLEPAVGGKFGHIAGRQYRFDIPASKANYEYLIDTYFSGQ